MLSGSWLARFGVLLLTSSLLLLISTLSPCRSPRPASHKTVAARGHGTKRSSLHFTMSLALSPAHSDLRQPSSGAVTGFEEPSPVHGQGLAAVPPVDTRSWVVLYCGSNASVERVCGHNSAHLSCVCHASPPERGVPFVGPCPVLWCSGCGCFSDC